MIFGLSLRYMVCCSWVRAAGLHLLTNFLHRVQLNFIYSWFVSFGATTRLQEIFATKICEEASAFLNVDISTLSNETRALAEIIIAVVKYAAQCIENIVDRQSKEVLHWLLG